MDGNRFDELARRLATRRSRRSVLGLIAGVAAGIAGASEAGADPRPDKPSKCYGEGSSCTNAKQCCSEICTNRRCEAAVPQCVLASDCPGSDTECRFRTCTDGACGFANAPAGTATSQQTPGDCHTTVCDGAGGVRSIVDDDDVSDDGNSCTIDTCQNGVPSSIPVAPGTPCGNGAQFCNSSGQCVDCLVAGDCPGQDTECQQRTCINGQCGVTNAPQGTVLSQQTPGDCRTAICNGNGGTASIAADTDVPADDGNPCTIEACNNGVPVHNYVPAGQPCGNGGVCNGNGGCGVCAPGATRSCFSGPGTPGMGICRAGVETCLPNGSGYGQCVGEVTAMPETCNGSDDNCNGLVDDGAICPPLPNASSACIDGQCVIVACNAGFANCNGVTADGCETAIFNNPGNCGACGVVCPDSAICQGTRCCTPNGSSPDEVPCCSGRFNQDFVCF